MKRPQKIGLFLLLATIFVAFLACILPAQTATAANPTTVSFQGKVVNADGTNVADGTYTFVFKLYTVSSGGSAVWTETNSSVTVAAGVFQVNLGAICPFFTSNACNNSTPIDFSTSNTLYMGITFNSDPAGEMSPRVQMQSVPYAFQADNAAKLGGIAASSYAQLSPGSQQSGFINVSGNGTYGGNIQGVNLNATTGFQLNGAATTGHYLRGNAGGTAYVDSVLQAGDLSGTVFTVASSTGSNQAIASGDTLSILKGSSNNLTTTGSATDTVTIDIISNPTFSGLVTASATGTNALAVTGTPLAGASGATSSLVQFGPNAISGGNSTATTGGTYIGINEPSSGAGSTADFLNFQFNGNLRLKVASTGIVSTGSTLNVLGSSLSPFANNNFLIRSNFMGGSGGVLTDTSMPSYSVNLGNGATDSFSILRAPATAGAPAYATLLTVSNAGDLTMAGTITGTTLNGTTGINTGASAGTQRIDSSGNLVNIGNLTAAAGTTISNTGSGNDITVTSQDQITLNTGTNGLLFTSTNAGVVANFTDTSNSLLKVVDGNVSGVNYGLLQLGAKASTGNEAAQCAAAGDVGKIYVNSTDKAIFACTASGAWEQLDNGRSNNTATAGTFTASTTDTIADTLSITPSTATSDVRIDYNVDSYVLNCTGLGCTQPTIAIRVVRGATCAGGTQIYTRSLAGAQTTTNFGVSINIVDSSPTALASNTYLICIQRTAGSGTITNTVTGRNYILSEIDISGADYAEIYYSASGDIAPGTVVANDSSIKAGVAASTGRYQKGLLGVVSTKPGQIIGDHTDSGTPVVVALAGRVPVKVSTENGAIYVGDYLTSSSTPGVAMRATKAGAIIGTSLTEYSGDGVGEVMLFVHQGQSAGLLPLNADNSSPDSQELLAALLTAHTEGAPNDMSEIFTDRLAAAVEIVTPKLVAQTVQTNNVVVGADGLNFVNESGAVVAKIDADGSFHHKAADNVDISDSEAIRIENKTSANPIETALEITNSGGGYNNLISTPKFQVAANGDLTNSGSVTIKGGSFKLLDTANNQLIGFDESGNASFSGNLNLASASLSGGITIGGDLSVAGLSTFQKLATFLAKTIFKQDVEFQGHITVAKDSAGYAKLAVGENSVHVDFKTPYDTPPIVSTTINNGQFVLVSVDAVTKDGFDIKLAEPAVSPISLSWTAVGVVSPQTAANVALTPTP